MFGGGFRGELLENITLIFLELVRSVGECKQVRFFGHVECNSPVSVRGYVLGGVFGSEFEFDVSQVLNLSAVVVCGI